MEILLVGRQKLFFARRERRPAALQDRADHRVPVEERDEQVVAVFRLVNTIVISMV